MKTGIYRHYKGGYYLLLGVAENATNDHEGELYVVYVSLNSSLPGPRMRIRRKHEFEGDVEVSGHHGPEKEPRFVYIGDEIPQ